MISYSHSNPSTTHLSSNPHFNILTPLALTSPLTPTLYISYPSHPSHPNLYSQCLSSCAYISFPIHHTQLSTPPSPHTPLSP